MIEKKYIELMNREIDGLITNGEKHELHRYLSDNGEAKEYYDELLSASHALNELPDPVVPENLEKRVINSIDFTRYAGKNRKKIAFNFTQGFNFRYAYTFAAGLLAGIIIFALFSINFSDFPKNDVSGTIGMEEAVTIKEIPIDLRDVQGSISLKEQNDDFLFEIQLNSVSPVDLTISYPDQLRLENFKPGIPGRISLITAGNLIKAENSGSQMYTFSFSSAGTNPPPVHVELSQHGKRVFENEFALNR
jgi:hypothetical protein